MGTTTPEEPPLPRHLQELARGVRPFDRIVTAHIPRRDAQLRQASRIDATGVDGDVDGLPVVTVGVAGVGGVEEEFAGRVVGKERRHHVSEIAGHVAEVVEGEGGGVAAAVPPGVADVLLIVPFAGGHVPVRFAAVGGEGLRVGVETDDAVDVVAVQGLRDDVGVEGVQQVIRLVGKGNGRLGEIPLAGKGQEFGGVLHNRDQGRV